MPTVLVTGATGLVGSHVTKLLCERGDRVRVTVRQRSRLDNLEGLDAERAEEVVAVLDLLVSATCWHRLRTLAGLGAGRGPRAAADAARAVVDRVASTPRKETP